MVGRRELVAVAWLAGCGVDLPEESLVLDERVLGIRVVAEAETEEAPRAEFLPLDEVRVEVLAVDREGELEPESVPARWLACPLAPNLPSFSCLSEAVPLNPADVPLCPTPEAGPVDLPSPCVLSDELAPTFAVPVFSQAFAGFALDLTLVMDTGEGADLDRCLQPLLGGEYDTPDTCRFTGYRTAIGPLSELAELNPSASAPPGLADAGPNHHPAPVIVRVGVGEDLAITPTGTTLSVRRGQSLQLRVDERETDRETYSVPVNNGESFTEVRETLSARWFRTDGEFEGQGWAPRAPTATASPGSRATATRPASTRSHETAAAASTGGGSTSRSEIKAGRVRGL